MSVKALLACVVIATTPVAANAVPVTGQLDIIGLVNPQSSTFQTGGLLDFIGTGSVLIGTGDFAGLFGSVVSLFDLTFTGAEPVYSVGGFTFTATTYFDFDNTFPGRGFSATGILSGNGFDDTPGTFSLSTQANNSQQTLASFSSSTEAILQAVPIPETLGLLSATLAGFGFLSLSSRRRRAGI